MRKREIFTIILRMKSRWEIMTNNNNIEDLDRKIEEQYKEYEGMFANIDENVDVDSKLKEINALINHVDDRIHYTESRITRTITFAVTLIGVGMALFAASLRLNGLPFYLGLATTGLFILTGIITVIVHVLQINPKYPFRALPNDWKWFYPRIIDENYGPSLFVWECKKKNYKKKLLHIKGLNEYAGKIINENPSERLKVDIQQLYLLHVNEKYKNSFLTSLRKVLILGLSITLVVLILFFSTIIYERINFNTVKTNHKIEATKVIKIKNDKSNQSITRLPKPEN